jgi:hypothetical protein
LSAECHKRPLATPKRRRSRKRRGALCSDFFETTPEKEYPAVLITRVHSGLEPLFESINSRIINAKKDDVASDLAPIGAAQRVEHYEISGYTTARNLAQQWRHTAVVALLSKSLAEEENADQLLNQVARSLMSVAKMPDAIEQAGFEIAE